MKSNDLTSVADPDPGSGSYLADHLESIFGSGSDFTGHLGSGSLSDLAMDPFRIQQYFFSVCVIFATFFIGQIHFCFKIELIMSKMVFLSSHISSERPDHR